MGRVITSRGACKAFLDDIAGFASSYNLDACELVALEAMSADLSRLMLSFVNKRQGTLRQASHRTLAMLNEGAGSLVEEFTDLYPPLELVQDDQNAFGEYLIVRTAQLAPAVPFGTMVAEMARAEHLYNRAFWMTTASVSSIEMLVPSQNEPFDPDRPIRLHKTVGLDDFGWDLRALHRYDPISIAALSPDPCVLLFHHTGEPNGNRVIRLKWGSARALKAIRDHGPISARAACDGLAIVDQVLGVIARLQAQRVVEPA